MKGKYVQRVGSFVLAALMLAGVGFASARTVAAQGRRIIIVRPNPYRYYRPFGFRRYDVFGYDRWGYDPWGYDRWGRDRWGNYRYGLDPRFSHYVFDNSEKAASQGYNDGFKTGKDDGKKQKSYNPERSHYFQEAGFGNFGEIYRTGFTRGYRDGFRAGTERLG